MTTTPVSSSDPDDDPEIAQPDPPAEEQTDPSGLPDPDSAED